MTLAPHSPSSPTAPLPGDARPQRGQMFVLYTGLLTTALALFGVYWLSRNAEDVNIMGWYANYVLPVGALLVGLAAGSGYGIGSAMSGSKISRRILLAIVALQIIAYFIAQYIEFRELNLVYEDTGEAIGFWEYFHLSAISFAWQQKDGRMGEPLGMWGYAFRVLEVVGFVAGGLIVPAVMAARPYCDTCRRYMKTKQLGVIPAGVPARKVKKSDAAGTAAYAAEQQQALDEGSARYERLREGALAGDVAGVRSELAPLAGNRKAASKLPCRLHVSLISCPGCSAGRLAAKRLTGQGKQIQTEVLPAVELSPEFVRAFTTA